MSRLDPIKLQSLLIKEYIVILEYYCNTDGDCSMIKCFLSKVFEYIIIYIPSKYRFKSSSIPPKSAVYTIEEIDKDSDLSSYTSDMSSANFCEEFISSGKEVSSYKDLKKDYDREMSIDGDDEPVIKKIKRQIDRLKLPFVKLKLNLGLQRGKYFGISFEEYDVRTYVLKKYYQSNSYKNFYITYMISLETIIEDVEDISENVYNVKKQFYNILKKISLSNLDKLGFSFSNSKMWELQADIDKNLDNYNILREKEEEIVSNTNSLDPKDVRNRNDINSISKKKIDIVNNGMKLLGEYHKKLMILEEISFDNLLMSSRVNKNFSILEQL